MALSNCVMEFKSLGAQRAVGTVAGGFLAYGFTQVGSRSCHAYIPCEASSFCLAVHARDPFNPHKKPFFQAGVRAVVIIVSFILTAVSMTIAAHFKVFFKGIRPFRMFSDISPLKPTHPPMNTG